MDLQFWVIQAFNGISYGALLFLLASGLTLIFGVMRIVNLAHGAYFLLGGFVSTYFITKLKNGKSDGHVFHWFYWLSIPSFQFRRIPPGDMREFLE